MSEVKSDQKPYRSPGTSDLEPSHRAAWLSRFVSLLVSLAFGALAAMVGFQLLVIAAFASMIDPDLTGREWWRKYAESLLFNGGPSQFVYFAACLFLSVFLAVACLLQLVCALFRRPTIGTSLIAAGLFAVVSTSVVIGGLLIVHA